MCEFSLFGNHFSNASQKQYCPAAQVVVNTPTWTHCLLTLLASLDAMSVFLHKDVCPYMCVWGCMGARWMQVNSLQGPTVPQASLAHHLTAMPDEVLCTNELVKQMSEQAREGCGYGWRVAAGVCRCTWLQQPLLDLPSCLRISPLFSFSLSVILSSQRALAMRLYFSLPLPISLLHSAHVILLFY